jgi:hypothetical protein
MEKTPWQIWKEKQAADAVNRSPRPWDLLNPEIGRVEEEEYQRRLDMCLNCEHLIKLTTTCKKCGCFMKEKTKLPHASCPVGKWDAVTVGPIQKGESNG